MSNSTRLVFMGSPDFAVPGLERLIERYPVVGVVTQPDRPAGRGRALAAPAVKQFAQQAGLPVIQPRRLSEPAAGAQLREWQPDLVVVAAFGQILKPDVLTLPRYGCLNVHASLLPRWRGAAPIQAAILNGDQKTGVTIMKMDAGLDTGPLISRREVPIRPEETGGELSARLSQIGAELLLDTLPGFLDGSLVPRPQDDSLATYAGLLKKADGALDPEMPAEFLARKVRAFQPWPGSFIEWKGQPLKVHQARAVEGRAPAGDRLVRQGLPALATCDGLLVFEMVQPAGKRVMSGETFLNGARDWGMDQPQPG